MKTEIEKREAQIRNYATLVPGYKDPHFYMGLRAIVKIWQIRPRDTNFILIDISKKLYSILNRYISLKTKILISACATSRFFNIIKLFSSDEEIKIFTFFREDFPPKKRLFNIINKKEIAEIQLVAMGGPGDAVRHGLIPARVSKLARLLLAYSGYYPGPLLYQKALHAYDRDVSYHAHEAVACALAYPPSRFSTEMIHFLNHAGNKRGGRSRRKTWKIARWAQENKFISLGSFN